MTCADLEFPNRADFIKAVERDTGEINGKYFYMRPPYDDVNRPNPQPVGSKPAAGPKYRSNNINSDPSKPTNATKPSAMGLGASSSMAQETRKVSYSEKQHQGDLERPKTNFASRESPSNLNDGKFQATLQSTSLGSGLLSSRPTIQQASVVQTPSEQTKPTAKNLASSLQVEDGWGAKKIINSKKPGAGSLLQTIQ